MDLLRKTFRPSGKEILIKGLLARLKIDPEGFLVGIHTTKKAPVGR